ncbi:MAG: protein O-mannosyl-transferase family [bacterium]
MEHKKLNRIIAFIIFLIGLAVYGKSVAPTASYWDCGEFIASSYIMGVPHPPGSPLFILVGRVFTLLPFFHDIGLRVNIISVIISALTIMLTYLIIVRLIREWKGIPETIEDKVTIYTGGIVGALAFAFSDSFWFNAVEAEVYAASMFFTAMVIWLIMTWLEKSESPAGDKVLLLIAYLVGLATGIHLLNILALPTVFLIVYFKRSKLNLSSFMLFALASAAAFGAIYPVIVKGIPWILEKFSFVALGGLVLLIFLGIYYAIQNRQRVFGLALTSILLIVAGYSTYTAIYIRSGLNPAIDENDPDEPTRLVSYLNREQYGDIPFLQRRAPFWEYQVKKMYVRYFGWQFIGKGTKLGPDNYIAETISVRGLWGLPFLVGFLGMFYHFQRDWKKSFSILTLFIMTGVAIAIYLNQDNPQPRERDYAYVGSFFAFALWIGIGAQFLVEYVANTIRSNATLKKVGIAAIITLLFVAVPYNMYSFNAHEHDRTGNYVPWDYSYNILQSCDPNAIIFTNGDNDTFPIWYLQYVEGIRTDIRVVNLSLLNTDWYIKQLRDQEPKVPITLTDDEIDALQPQLLPGNKKEFRLTINVPRQTVLNYVENEKDNANVSPENIPEKPRIEFNMKGTLLSGRAIRVQDIMVDHIIRANRFEKPIYFAVTVSPENMLGLNNPKGLSGLRNYLRMDGLAFKVMPYGNGRDFIAPEKLETNLLEKFRFRNLNNPKVFIDRGTIGLLQNYRNAFFRLANYYQIQNMKDKVLAVLDRMNEVMPEEIIPTPNYRISLTMGQMYYDAGRPQELKKRLDYYLDHYNLGPVDKLTFASYYSQYFHETAKAESLALSVKDEYPQTPQAYGWLIGNYIRSNEYQKGIDLLDEWLQLHPTDRQAKQQLAQLTRMLDRQDSSKVPNSAGGDGSNVKAKD